MLELDVLLQRFLADGYATLDRAGKARFAQLLEMEDDRLWRWLGGAVTPAAAGMADIVERIRICR